MHRSVEGCTAVLASRQRKGEMTHALALGKRKEAGLFPDPHTEGRQVAAQSHTAEEEEPSHRPLL